MSDPEIFRRQALDQQAAAKGVEPGLSLVGSGAQLAALTALVVAAVAVGWSMTARVPIHVDGAGILLESGGVATVAADTAGRIVKMHVDVGTPVRAGAIVAEIAQADVAADLVDARGALEAAMVEQERGRAVVAETRAARRAHDAGREAAAARLVALEREQLGRLMARQEARAKLARDGYFSQMALIESEQQVIDSRRRIDELQAPVAQFALEARTREAEESQRLVDLDLKVDQARRRVRLAGERLARNTYVRAATDGFVASVRVQVGDVVSRETELVTLVHGRDDARDRQALVGHLFVPADRGAQIRPGMPAQVVPTTVKKAEYGYIRGTVRRVSPLPVGSEEVQKLVRNRLLAETLVRAGPPVLVEVAFDHAPGSTNGFAWTSSRGPSIAIGHGTELTGRVAVREERIAVVALPWLRHLLPDAPAGPVVVGAAP